MFARDRWSRTRREHSGIHKTGNAVVFFESTCAKDRHAGKRPRFQGRRAVKTGCVVLRRIPSVRSNQLIVDGKAFEALADGFPFVAGVFSSDEYSGYRRSFSTQHFHRGKKDTSGKIWLY